MAGLTDYARNTAISNALTGYVNKTTEASHITFPAFDDASQRDSRPNTYLAQKSLQTTLQSIRRNQTVISDNVGTVSTWASEPSQAPSQRDHFNAHSALFGVAADHHNAVQISLLACKTTEDQIHDTDVDNAEWIYITDTRAIFV
ncbi:hypothetical protein IAT40_006833 [Kwoniella sp. CBS 6097]